MKNPLKKKKPTVQSPYLQAKAKAQSALNMFSNAMKELTEANEILETKKHQDLQLIKSLEQGINSIEKDINTNLKAMAKLADFVPLTEEEESVGKVK